MTTLSEEFEGPVRVVGPQEEENGELAQLYQAAKDENELLEFKNYELLFKIQELEQKQEKILDKLKSGKLLSDTQNHENSHSLMLTPTTNLRRHSTSDFSFHSSTQLKAANNGQDDAEESCDDEMALGHPVWASEREKQLFGGCLELDSAVAEAATGSQTARFQQQQQPVSSTNSSSSTNNNNNLNAAGDDHHDDSDSQLSSIASSSTGGHHSALYPEHDTDDLTKKHGEPHYYSLFARKLNKRLAAVHHTQPTCPPELPLLADGSSRAPTAAVTTNHSHSFCGSKLELERGVVDNPEQPKEKEKEKVDQICEWSSKNESEMSSLNTQSAPIRVISESPSTLVDQTHSLPAESLKLKLICSAEKSSSSTLVSMSPQVASSRKRETVRLGARKLTRSQPDLSCGQTVSNRLRSTSTSGGAKIAVPVAARKQQQVMALQAAITRSKSNLTDSSGQTANQVSARRSGRPIASPAVSDQVVAANGDESSPINSRSDSSTRTNGRLLRSRSSSSVGFVTQIPTLIGHSHASYIQSCRTQSTARPTAKKINRQPFSVKVNRAQVVVAASSKSQQQRTRISGSKSMSNLVLGDLAHKADNDDDREQQEPLVTESEKYDEEKREEVASRDCELSGTGVKMTDCEQTSSSSNMSQQSLIDGQHELSYEKLVDVESIAGRKAAKFQSNSNNCGQQTFDINNNNISSLGNPIQCAQCKVYQSNVELLTKDKKQLSEQLSELEEMENDSRLMSQKLAQQMLNLEEQFETCKSELERTCDRETKLQLQNKKLNFELKQRAETIQQLQCQVSRLEMKFSLKEQQQPHLVDSNNDNNNNSTAIATETEGCKKKELNSTRNLKDLDAEFENDHLSTQSRSQKESTVEKGMSHVTVTTDAKDCSPTLSVGTTSDDDSAIELQVAKRQQQVDLRQTDRAKGQTSADDSAYSKSSASSDANSDDGNRSDSEQLTSSLKVARQQAEKVEDPLQVRRSSSSSSGDESDHQTTGCSSSLACSSPSSLESAQTGSSLSSRQQVMRKKISIARILRGIQIQQSSSASKTNSELLSGSTSSSKALLVGQARLAQVVGGDEITGYDHSVDSSGSCFKDKNQIAGVKVTDKSHIDLALEGVHDLEKGSCAEDLLRLLAQDSSPGRAGSFLTTESDANQTHQLDPEMFKLIGQLRREIVGLRTRLIQAHTLNDNLVSELRSSKDRFGQLESHLTSLQLQPQPHQPRIFNPATKTTSFLGRHQTTQSDWQQQQLHLPQTTNAAGQAELAARKSIIYVNGSGSGTQICQQQPLPASVLVHQQHQHKCKSCSCHLQYKYHPVETACVNLNELVEFLRFLLDKIHFHHGRTFELVNECQKLAINSLLASQNHQLNTLAHNSVILAGNQASRALAQQQQLYHPVELYPVRPPPRMRRNRMIVMPSSASLEEKSFSSATQEKPLSKLTEQLPTSVATSTVTTPTFTPTTTVGRSSTSALQVAKQTLFSIVPIYYNNSKNNVEKQLHTSNKNSQLKITKKQSECTRRSESDPLLQNTTSSPLTSDLPTNHYQAFKSNGWIVLDQSPNLPNGTAKQQKMNTNMDTNSLNRIKLSVDQQQISNSTTTIDKNVSILEINRSELNVNSNPDNLVRDTYPYFNIQQQPQTYSSSFSNQMFQSSQHSLCEDIERYRAQFNGQLLDLLTRQNWCESIITEKLKFYQNHTSQSIFPLNIQKETQNQQLNDQAKSIGANNIIHSTNVPLSNNNSFNTNGLNNPQQVLANRQSWPNGNQVASSFC